MKQESSIDPVELKKLMDADFNGDFIDVRTPVEFDEVHAMLAQNRPMESIHATDLQGASQGDQAKPIYLICRSGNRSSKVCRQLREAGAQNVLNVKGGTDAWIAAGLPVVLGGKAMSLVRQVRTAAGFLVLAGVGLSQFFNPYLCALSAFVGAGLMIAGLTNWCGMGLLLLKMPWNQRPGSGCQA